MACVEYKALLPKYAEGSLVPDQVRLLRDHLPTCESCRETVRLLKLDDDAIGKMLFGRQREAARKRGRLYRTALFFGGVLLVTLCGLYLAYRSVSVPEPPESVAESLDRRFSIEVEEVRLDEFLELLGRRAKVRIRLADAALERLAPLPRVTLAVREATLREILARLARDYDLEYRTSDRSILME